MMGHQESPNALGRVPQPMAEMEGVVQISGLGERGSKHVAGTEQGWRTRSLRLTKTGHNQGSIYYN